jgi:PAS domain S-box-containing protein
VAVTRAQGADEQLREIFERARVPMVLVDESRHYADANEPARKAFRLSMDELRALAVEDLSPLYLRGSVEQMWRRLLQTGFVTGSSQVANLDGSTLELAYFGVANALPGLHLLAFAPAHSSEDGSNVAKDGDPLDPPISLTPREIEILTLAARGYSGPEIAQRLVVSPATVKTHFAHIHEKLGVPSRAAAVARAMQLGVIE